MGGVPPHTAPVRCRAPPPRVVHVSSLCAGAGSSAGHGPRGGRRRGAWGRAACGLSCAPPPGRRGPFGGRGDVLSASGGVEGRRPRGLQAGGGSGGERGVRAAQWFPTPLARRDGPWLPAQSPSFSSAPPRGIYVQPGLAGSLGCRARPGRPSVGQPRGLARGAPRGGGRGGLFAVVCTPAYPGQAPRHVASSVPRPPYCIHGCRRSAAAHRVPLSAGAELPVGSGHCGGEWAADWGHLARGRASRGCVVPPLGATALLGGVRGRRLPGRLPAIRRPGGGRGGEGGSVPAWSPVDPKRSRGGGGGSGPAGPAADGGGALFPAPLQPLGARPSCRPLLGPPALLAGGGGGECWGRRPGSAVSG